MRKVTISQIAKAAGVSKTSVSFAFNAPEQLSAATVAHIRDIAERMGYTPDPIARSMTTRRTNAIGLLLPQDIATAFANPFYTQFIRGVGTICGQVGYSLMLVPPLWGSLLKAIPHATVDGFIVLGLDVDRGEVQQLRRRLIPFVMVDTCGLSDIPSVTINDRSGAYAAMDYLLSHGHRRIAVIRLPSEAGSEDAIHGTVAERLEGYRAALAAYSMALEDPRIHVVYAPASREGGRRVFEQIWSATQRPTAVIAMCDITAIGVIEAAHAYGLCLPQELSVVGFDDLPEAAMVRPALTTVRQPVEAKGRLAAEALVAALNGAQQPVHHRLETELVERESVTVVQSSDSSTELSGLV